jgi:hypothetical protein
MHEFEVDIVNEDGDYCGSVIVEASDREEAMSIALDNEPFGFYPYGARPYAGEAWDA